MHYSVPQFIEVEDRIIGPLTLKQFLILLFGGLVCLFYYSIFKIGIFFFVLALPTVGAFAMLAFGKFNGRPLLSILPHALKFLKAPRVRVWQRTAEKTLSLVKKAAVKEEAVTALEQPVSTRLHKLAYFLDQQTAEEERLIHSGQIKTRWLNQI